MLFVTEMSAQILEVTLREEESADFSPDFEFDNYDDRGRVTRSSFDTTFAGDLEIRRYSRVQY